MITRGVRIYMGSHAASTAYLLSDAIQGDINDLLDRGSATSLEVERKHHQDKQSAQITKVRELRHAPSTQFSDITHRVGLRV